MKTILELDVPQVCKRIEHLIKIDYDVPIIISSTGTGTSKSTLGLHLFCAMMKKRYHKKGKKFKIDDLEKELGYSLIYSRAEFLNKIKTSKKKIFVLDEMILVGYNRFSLQRLQKVMVQILNISRCNNHILIFILSNFWEVDKGIRETICRLHFFIDKRGSAIIFKKSSNPMVADRWMQKENQKLLKNWETNPYLHARVCRNYYANVFFDKIEGPVWKLYERLRDEKKKLLDKPKSESITLNTKIYNQIEFRLLSYLRKNKLIVNGGLQFLGDKYFKKSIGHSLSSWDKKINTPDDDFNVFKIGGKRSKDAFVEQEF